MHAAQPGIRGDRLGVGEIGIGLAREANDDVGGHRDVGGLRAQRADQVEVIVTSVEATHPLQHTVAAGLQRDVQVPAKSRGRGQLDQLRREVVGVDRAEAQACRCDRLQQPRNEGREGRSAVAAEGAQVHAGQHDLSIAIGDRELRPLDQRRFLITVRHAARPPDDAVGAAVIAAVLHLQEEARAREGRRPAFGGRGEVGGDVVEKFALSSIRKRHVDTGDRGNARVRIVDMTAGQDEVRLRMTAPQAMHHRPKLAVGLGRDGAAVDHPDISVLVAIRHGEAGTRQPVAKLGHFGEIHLAAERLNRDLHRCWTRIAAATTGARRARRMRGPRVTKTPSRSRISDSSVSVPPPRGPTAIVYAREPSIARTSGIDADGSSTSSFAPPACSSAAANETGPATSGTAPRWLCSAADPAIASQRANRCAAGRATDRSAWTAMTRPMPTAVPPSITASKSGFGSTACRSVIATPGSPWTGRSPTTRATTRLPPTSTTSISYSTPSETATPRSPGRTRSTRAR